MGSSLLLWLLPARLHSFLAVKAVDSLGLGLPAFSPKHHSDSSVAKANPRSCNLLHSTLRGLVHFVAFRFVEVARYLPLDQPTRSCIAHREGSFEPINHLPLSCRLQSSFEMTSCSMCLSRLRSAQLLELCVFLSELPKFAYFAHTHFAADIHRLCSALHLLQCIDDFFRTVSTFLYFLLSWLSENPQPADTPVFWFNVIIAT